MKFSTISVDLKRARGRTGPGGVTRIHRGRGIFTSRSVGKDMLDSASIVSSTAARLSSTPAMAGDVMSVLREVKFSLTAELIAD